MQGIILPDWALKEEHYEPKGDREYFISRSLLRIIGILSVLQMQGARSAPKRFSAVASTGFAFLLILLCAASHTTVFLLCVLAAELVVMCALTGREILRLLRNSLLAALFGGFLVLPAVFFGSGLAVFMLPAKTFLTVTALGLLTNFFAWHNLTAAMRSFFVPEIVVFILDTALRHIVLLGRQARELLTALSLRSVGRNTKKETALAGVLGTMFLRTQEMSEEMYQAMCCRCFTGEYVRPRRNDWRIGDAVLAAAAVLCVGLFFWGQP